MTFLRKQTAGDGSALVRNDAVGPRKTSGISWEIDGVLEIHHVLYKCFANDNEN